MARGEGTDDAEGGAAVCRLLSAVHGKEVCAAD